MKRSLKMIAGVLVLATLTAVTVLLVRREVTPPHRQVESGNRIHLPPPQTKQGMSVAEAIATRRSRREFRDQSLSAEQVSQLCWAAQGITNESFGLRTAPSAGALYPATIFFVDRDGGYEYVPAEHTLRCVIQGDLRKELQAIAHNQDCVGMAPGCFVVVMDVARTATKYGDRAERYCFIEAGHIAQNLLLQATSEGLSGVPVGAFEDQKLAALLGLPQNLRPVYILPIGYAK